MKNTDHLQVYVLEILNIFHSHRVNTLLKISLPLLISILQLNSPTTGQDIFLEICYKLFSFYTFYAVMYDKKIAKVENKQH